MQEQERAYEHPGEAHVTRIKRKAIVNSIQKINVNRPSTTWNVAVSIPPGGNQAVQQTSSLLELPGEIRNIIYRYALDIDSSQERVPRHGSYGKDRAGEFALLGTCRQIAAEAKSMFESEVSAYVPVMGAMDFGILLDLVHNHGASKLLPVQNTVLIALSTSMKVHIHLHTMWTAKDIDLQIDQLDPMAGLVLGRLRQALLIFVSQSATLSQLHAGKKRRAVVHLDHLYSDWLDMTPLVGPWKMNDIVNIMGRDENTEWELRTYVWTGTLQHGLVSDDYALGAEGFHELVELSKKYKNIEVIAEVYGELVWSCEPHYRGGIEVRITREITPSSVVWPSYPDDVPWRVPRPGHEI